MKNYRMLFYDLHEQVRAIKEFRCPDDGTAIRLAAKHSNGAAFELRDNNRIVMRSKAAREFPTNSVD